MKMDHEKVKDFIELIFNRELAQQRAGKSTWLKSKNASGKRIVAYENAKALIDVFSNIKDPEVREYFGTELLERISDSQEEYKIDKGDTWHNKKPVVHATGGTALSFFTLLQIGVIDSTIAAYQSRVISKNCFLLLRLLRDIFYEEFNYFTVGQLNHLTENFPGLHQDSDLLSELADEVLEYLTENGFRILQREVKGVNIEINRDKESVIQKFGTLGLGPKYEQFLNELDAYINTNSGLVASGMISNFRTFWEDLIIDLAKRLSTKVGRPIPKSEKTPISDARKFLTVELGLSEADHALITDFVKVLHSQGGHAFTSSVEYLRMARNIGIEILLMLLTKMDSAKA